MSPEHLCRYLEGQGHSMTLQQNQVGPLTCYLKSDLTIISQRWSPYWIYVSHATFGWLPWRSRSQHDLAAKLCLAHNFVIWSWILQLFHRNDHHIETTCHVQHLGRYLEGQCHSMTLHQNCVQPITMLFEVGFFNFSQKWSPYWDDMLHATFGSLPWKSMSQHDLAAKLCPAHNYVIWSQI
jgi:hypothetical protein